MFSQQNTFILAAVVCFATPVLGVVAMNWEQARPYLIADAKTAQGHVLYLYAPG